MSEKSNYEKLRQQQNKTKTDEELYNEFQEKKSAHVDLVTEHVQTIKKVNEQMDQELNVHATIIDGVGTKMLRTEKNLEELNEKTKAIDTESGLSDCCENSVIILLFVCFFVIYKLF